MKIIYKVLMIIIKIILKIMPSKSLKLDYNLAQKNIRRKYNAQELWNDKDLISENTNIKFELSIIVPVYNVEKYLEKCMDSIINQKTNFSYEVICVNDGSTDSSLEILNKYANKYKQVKIISEKNQGLSAARNTGIKNSSGKYLMFIDSDDYIAETCVEKLMKEATKEDYDLVKAGYIEFSSETNQEIKRIEYINTVITEKNKLELDKVKGHAWGCVLKRELFNNIRFPIGYWYEDIIMKLLIFPKCKKIKIVDDILYYYRINLNGLSRKTQKQQSYKCLEQYYLVEKSLEKYRGLAIEITDYTYNNLLNELSTVLWLRTRRLDSKTKKEVFILSCNIIYQIKYRNGSEIEKIMLKKDYTKWQLYAIYKMIGIKFGVE